MNLLLLMATPTGGSQNPLPNILMIVSIVAVFYFFMIRPQSKKLKDQKTFLDKLQKGDRVITNHGIHGKITEVDPSFFMVEIDHNVRVKMEKSAISMELSEALNKPKVASTEVSKS